LCDIGKEHFMDVLGKALQLIHVDWETVTLQVMVREQKVGRPRSHSMEH
jgi:hypothetical protein